MFSKETISAIVRSAEKAGLPPAALLALCDIESGGTALVTIRGVRKPLIRFEGHYFDRRLSGEKREQARRAGLSSPKAGAIANPRTQAARWALYEKACAIDAKAAAESVSWGVGQVMGAHWAWLGYPDIAAFTGAAEAGMEGQMDIMLRFIAKSGIAAKLAARDWSGVARAYNGPAYRKLGYDTRLRLAERRWAQRLDGAAGRTATRSPASANDDRSTIVELQRMLTALGYPAVQDGISGPETREAVRRFQADNGLVADGIPGPLTRSAIGKAFGSGKLSGKRMSTLMRLLSWMATVMKLLR